MPMGEQYINAHNRSKIHTTAVQYYNSSLPPPLFFFLIYKIYYKIVGVQTGETKMLPALPQPKQKLNSATFARSNSSSLLRIPTCKQYIARQAEILLPESNGVIIVVWFARLCLNQAFFFFSRERRVSSDTCAPGYFSS